MSDDFLPISEAAARAMTTEGALAKRIERGQIAEADLRRDGRKRLVRLSAVLELGRAVRSGQFQPSVMPTNQDDKSDIQDDKMSELRADLEFAMRGLVADTERRLSEFEQRMNQALARSEGKTNLALQELTIDLHTWQEEVREMHQPRPAPARERQQRPFLALASVLRLK